MASKLEEAAIEGLQAVANLGVDHRSPEPWVRSSELGVESSESGARG